MRISWADVLLIRKSGSKQEADIVQTDMNVKL